MLAGPPITPSPTSGICRPARGSIFSRRPSTLLLILPATILCACAGSNEPVPQPELAAEGKELFGAPPAQPTGPARANAKPTEDAWSIVLVAYRDANRHQVAQQDLLRVRQTGLTDAYVDDRGEATVIAYGSYRSPDDRKAQQDLERIRQMVVDDGRPFSGALLTPPSAADAGSLPQYDLRNAKEMLGNWVVYTLQVGAYGRLTGRATPDEMAQARQAAEQAAAQLRREGEQAWYYHGPTMSMVLVGAFGADEFEPNPVAGLPPLYESPALKAAREKFPYNLVNGQGLRDRSAGTLQTSSLVGVPDG